MKKLLLSIFIASTATLGFSQGVVLEILTPSDQAGFKPLAFVPGAAAGWDNVPDLEIPANSITGELVFVLDGTAADSLGCEPLVNGADVAGKIGVVWRGTCPFAVKAFNVWSAGAIGVMIVNNAAGADPIVPGGGTGGEGVPVDVPVFMTDRATGEALAPSIDAGEATAFVGVIQAANNLRIESGLVVRAQGATFTQAICQNAAEFSVPMGSFVINDGSSSQTGVTVSATIFINDNPVYSESLGGQTIPPGDTLFFALPTFSQSSYPLGRYVTTYTLDQDLEDDFPLDNGPIDASFTMTEDRFSYSSYNQDSLNVNSAQYFRPAAFTSPFSPCIAFRDPNASRLQLNGVTFAASADPGVSLAGATINVTAFEWNDEFVDVNDVAFNLLDQAAFGFYDFAENTPQTTVYGEFEDPIILADNQRYLVCVATTNGTHFLGYAPSNVDYTSTQDVLLQPMFPLISGTTTFLNGFGLDLAPSIALVVEDITVGTTDRGEVNITPFPNPAADYIGIPYTGPAGQAILSMYDVAGKLVKEERITFAGQQVMQVNMEGVENGTYMFNLRFSDNTTSNFKVVVAR